MSFVSQSRVSWLMVMPKSAAPATSYFLADQVEASASAVVVDWVDRYLGSAGWFQRWLARWLSRPVKALVASFMRRLKIALERLTAAPVVRCGLLDPGLEMHDPHPARPCCDVGRLGRNPGRRSSRSRRAVPARRGRGWKSSTIEFGSIAGAVRHRSGPSRGRLRGSAGRITAQVMWPRRPAWPHCRRRGPSVASEDPSAFLVQCHEFTTERAIRDYLRRREGSTLRCGRSVVVCDCATTTAVSKR